MPDFARYETDHGVAVVTVDNPPVNAMSPGVPEAIVARIEQAGGDAAVRAVVLIGAGRTFIAGADIRELEKIARGEQERGKDLFPVLDALEGSEKPVVAAIHGAALGGGLEIAMACHYRIALVSAQLGQPEVKIGLIPGAAGTQRLPRLAGVRAAARMCAFGEPIRARSALELGLIDRIVDGEGYNELRAAAVSFARFQASEGGPLPHASRRNDKLGDLDENTKIFAEIRAELEAKRRGFLAPRKAVDAVEAATKLSFAAGVKREEELFLECMRSDQSRALMHAFFGEREVRKIPDVPKDTPTREIRRAAVVGAGTMGGGIAMVYANAGVPVLLKDVSAEALENGLETIRRNYERSLKRGRIGPEEVGRRIALITPTLDYDTFDQADIVVEAVYEDLALKKEVFYEIDRAARPGAILATNTSTLDVDRIAAVTSRPEDVVGHHFFSPANAMRLLEIVRGRRTSKEVIATSMALAKRLGKVGVLVGNHPGFVGNRLFEPYRREAQLLVEDGAGIEQVDRALEAFGMAMGPLAVGDLAGLDVGMRIRKEHPEMFERGGRAPLIEDEICEKGWYGRKTGRGWYVYDDDHGPKPNPDVEKLLGRLVERERIPQREISDEEIVDRLILSLVNEGARALADETAMRAVDIDMIYLHGYGFPAYRGGPMWYASTYGLDRAVRRCREFERTVGPWWAPAPLLEELAAAG